MFEVNVEELRVGIKKLSEPKVLVIGDLAIDEMVYGYTSRMSREAPVLILHHYETKQLLGAASNAAHNLSVINGGKVGVIGLYGEDYYGPVLLKVLNDAGINTDYTVKDSERVTTVKTRISGSCSQSVTQQIVRIDRETQTPLSEKTEQAVIEKMEKAIPLFDAVILSDYNIGILTDKIIKKAIEIAKKHNKVIVVDAQKNLERYKGATSLTPNQPDTEGFLGYKITDSETLKKAGADMLEKTEAQCVLITRGDKGMALFDRKRGEFDVPVFNKTSVFDVTGAGDTVVALYTLGLAAGLKPEYAAIIGNLAASIVIRYFGCATTTIDELLNTLDKIDFNNFKN
ncbi:bifunctional hydroxymethylpyrimidine kinase/phosphomethylpyrimidine kinase [bacterium]|nr:bifunctional hydroxymethylpyrimidine kinase/phosphomethylpyrimidine kinase [bacterium]